ncbi:hypothetical protein IQ07DRAFT_636453 [Pyrenochaeta sp. DS3sAY3a]|nr:hypothetical protein IQ07DRAFT_636453 [Pyrenochaeta sp. DS3sAY3a]
MSAFPANQSILIETQTTAKNNKTSTATITKEKENPTDKEKTVQPSKTVAEPTTTTQNNKAEPPAEPPLPPSQTLTRLSKDTWVFEVLSFLFSIACLIGSVVILRVYDGRSLPEWPYNISLNTLISLLSTFMVMSLIVPISAGLSQCKWLWFVDTERGRGKTKGARYLADFGAFDMASRGPWGCLLLLKTAWNSPLAVLGIVVTVCSLAIQPMIQQSVTYPIRNTAIGEATVARATNYTQWFIGLGTGTQGAGFENRDQNGEIVTAMKAAILQGMANPNSSLSDIPASCSTGNCTFSPYSTLAVCANTANVTSDTVYNNSESRWVLPNGVYLYDYGFYYMNVTTLANWSIAFNESQNPLVSIYIVQGDFQEKINQTLEIMLQLCVQTLSTTVDRGQTNTTLISSFNESTYENGVLTLHSPTDDRNYTIPDVARTALVRGLQSIFSGLAGRGQGTVVKSSDAIHAIQAYGSTEAVQQVAMSMTNSFRIAPSLEDAPPAVGVALGQTVYVRIAWAWLVLPITLEVLAAAFLAGVIWHSRRAGIWCWKSESLPVLHGLSEEIQVEMKKAKSTAEMEALAEKQEVRLGHNGQVWLLKRRLN